MSRGASETIVIRPTNNIYHRAACGGGRVGSSRVSFCHVSIQQRVGKQLFGQ